MIYSLGVILIYLIVIKGVIIAFKNNKLELGISLLYNLVKRTHFI